MRPDERVQIRRFFGAQAQYLKNNFSYLVSGSFTSLCLVIILSCGHGLEDHMMQRPECQMWAKLENKTLPLQDQGHANCTTNSDCTGFTCKGIYQVSNSTQFFVAITNMREVSSRGNRYYECVKGQWLEWVN